MEIEKYLKERLMCYLSKITDHSRDLTDAEAITIPTIAIIIMELCKKRKGKKMKDWLASYFIGFALTLLIITLIELKG